MDSYIDLDRAQEFVRAITGTQIGLPLPDGGVIELSRVELAGLIEEAALYRALLDERAVELEAGHYAQAVVDDLSAYVRRLEAIDQVDPVLVRILEQADEPEPEHDPGLVNTVLSGLAAMNVAAKPEQAVALLDLIEAFVENQSSNGHNAATQVVTQSAPAPAPTQEVPKLLVPRPANPPPFKEVTAEQLFGLQRGAGGRYDSGGL